MQCSTRYVGRRLTARRTEQQSDCNGQHDYTVANPNDYTVLVIEATGAAAATGEAGVHTLTAFGYFKREAWTTGHGIMAHQMVTFRQLGQTQIRRKAGYRSVVLRSTAPAAESPDQLSPSTNRVALKSTQGLGFACPNCQARYSLPSPTSPVAVVLAATVKLTARMVAMVAIAAMAANKVCSPHKDSVYSSTHHHSSHPNSRPNCSSVFLLALSVVPEVRGSLAADRYFC